MKKGIIVFPIISGIWFLMVIVWGGITYPGYEHMSQFISELGATGAPYGSVVSRFGFIPASVFLSLFSIYAIYLSSRRYRQVVGLIGIGIYAITLSIAAVYPCDFGCRPENPSFSQNIHNLFAIIGYLSGIVGIFVLASDVSVSEDDKRLGLIGRVLGFIAIVMFLLLSPEFKFVGLVQRMFELIMYSWIVLYALKFRVHTLNS